MLDKLLKNGSKVTVRAKTNTEERLKERVQERQTLASPVTYKWTNYYRALHPARCIFKWKSSLYTDKYQQNCCLLH